MCVCVCDIFQTDMKAFNVKSQNEDNIIWGLVVYYFARNGNQCRHLPLSICPTLFLQQSLQFFYKMLLALIDV